VGAAHAALEVLRAEPDRVERLARNARALRAALAARGVATGGSSTQITPVIVGDAGATVRACERALEGGVFGQAIRPPTVPEGTSRLRLAAMATHDAVELRAAAATIADAVTAEGPRWRDEAPGAATLAPAA
jgi:8-amino-7-oxononanoate synthase